MDKRGIGYKYESLAKSFLINKGLLHIESNFYSCYGEIDHIFKDNGTLVFVEVKYRKNSLFGLAEEAVNLNKLKKIVNTSLMYINEKEWLGDYRYDLIAINDENITWIKNII